MTDHASPAGHRPGSGGASGHGQRARFELVAAGDGARATVRAAGDIDLTNAARFQAALDQAVAAAADVTADLTAVTYCDSAAIRALFSAARRSRLTIQVTVAGPITATLLRVSGLDQIATVVTPGSALADGAPG
jgi:anti-sigma B factor antagonist